MAEVARLHAATFEDFWAAYPKRVGKAKTKVLFDMILKGTKTRTLNRDGGDYIVIEHPPCSVVKLVSAAKAYGDQLPRNADFSIKDEQYILHPLTFLNSGRYMDFL